MTTHKEALKLALEALGLIEFYKLQPDSIQSFVNYYTPRIKEALAQPEQEPDGEAHLMQEGFTHCIWSEAAVPVGTKLYTTPPQRTWVDLTDEQMWNAYTGGSDIINLDYAKSIVALFKEKNT